MNHILIIIMLLLIVIVYSSDTISPYENEYQPLIKKDKVKDKTAFDYQPYIKKDNETDEKTLDDLLPKIKDGGIKDGGIKDGGIKDGGIKDGGIKDGGIKDKGIKDGGIKDKGIKDGGIIISSKSETGALNANNLPKPEDYKLSAAELKKLEEEDYTIFKNMKANLTASQSSRNPMNKYGAALSLDDNLTTYSSTNIIKGYPSWIQYKSTKNLEIKEINITGRIGGYEIKKRLVPFNITIYFNDIIISTKRFVEVQDNYVWKPIGLIGNKIKIVQELVSYLEISNFILIGRLAQKDCEKYAKKSEALYNSCKKTLTEVKPEVVEVNLNPYLGLTQEEIRLAKEFEKVLIKEDGIDKIKAAKAEKLWAVLQKQIVVETETAKNASKLGMAPPPPLYSQQQIDTVKKYLPRKKPQLSGIEKANCMRSLNQINTLNDQAMIAGRESQTMSYRQEDAKRYTLESQAILANYNIVCRNKAS